ncbi:helix-turn-helix transcriptional regulator [Sutcliffiella horikoshii]|uniref:helix-turn-helix domain-containing protein n=1 Tax=Sutcliffiella horikoshii TaxID=79883 RepID=UPI00203BBBB0|nr:helix-turn-helix domain-containing protein [Sutcliffiella horikoshii]MCM3617904.1 helix-turn-helix transcriptional regulator [Sutcliffiella horikoshii]
MMDSKLLGEEIKRLRKQQLLSQKELSDGICCQTTISSIEKGRALPSIDILYFIALRLNVTIDYFFQNNYQNNQTYISDTIISIEEYVKSKKYHEVHEITKLERKLSKARDLGRMFNQFIDWHFFRSAQLIGLISWEECVEQLKLLLLSKERNKVHFQNLRIKNVIANVYAENGDYKEALKHYTDILNVNIKLEAYRRFKLKVYFNLSKLYFYENLYEQSIEVAERGIKLSQELEDISMLGNLYIQASQSMLKLKDYESSNIQVYLDNAKFVFQMTNNQKCLEFIGNLEKQVAELKLSPV